VQKFHSIKVLICQGIRNSEVDIEARPPYAATVTGVSLYGLTCHRTKKKSVNGHFYLLNGFPLRPAKEDSLFLVIICRRNHQFLGLIGEPDRGFFAAK